VSEIAVFRLPDIGEGIAEAEVVQWLVAVGDTVAEDQPVVAVETDKSQVELPSPFGGTVTELHCAVGDVVAVGAALISVGGDAPATGGAPGGADAAPNPDTPRSLNDRARSVHNERSFQAAGPSRKTISASPSTRKLAARLGIDLAAVDGTGPNGRVLAADLTRYEAGADTALGSPVSSAEPFPAGSESEQTEVAHNGAPAHSATTVPRGRRAARVIPVRGLRRQIAKSMTQSLQIPQITEFREVDATALIRARAALKPRFDRAGIALSVFPFLVSATVRALVAHPNFNAAYDAAGQRVIQHGGVDIGIATATGDGLVVPVVRDADLLGLRELTTEIDRVAQSARDRKAPPSALSDAGATVTNFGSFGTWLGTPIIRSPEVVIVGFGRIAERVIPVDGSPEVRPVLPIAVSADHRVNDGSDLGAFVTEIADALVEPYLLLA
jgi:pyruvate/2-oxoglutarate dehydrogenase complex dihydrolipoamide acyltransferase (E2) component